VSGEWYSRRSVVSLAACAAAGAVLGVAGCSQGQPQGGEGGEGPQEPPLSAVTIRLDGKARAEHAGLFAAVAQKMLADAGLDVTLEEAADENAALEAVQAAECAYAVMSQRALAKAFGGEEPYSVLAVAALLQPKAGSDAADGYPLLLVANDSYLLHRPEETSALLGAVREGYAFVQGDAAKAAGVLEEKLHAKKGALEEDLAKAAPQFAQGDAWGRIEQDVWDACFAAALKAGDIENEIPPHHGYSMDYLEDASK